MATPLNGCGASAETPSVAEHSLPSEEAPRPGREVCPPAHLPSSVFLESLYVRHRPHFTDKHTGARVLRELAHSIQ